MSDNDDANVERVVPLLIVRDMQASLDFYVGGLGFRVARRWNDGETLRWCWLELGGSAVMLQLRPPRSNDSASPAASVGGGVTFNFICRDVITLYSDFIARGVACERPFVGNGMWGTGIVDVDGYRLFFESPTDVAEGSVLA